ncbi:DinB family protein [Echinicola sp. CAU 1574]|uniref:DinB family protein n=1 Tax=Echinicola arenosa TaxID=2774144 RepID=A0ABR9AF13_9BACT|nr:DinB family protein [Echinicola arenosa]MBD8487394.1 DinB family protein [Echinicola arenosa]
MNDKLIPEKGEYGAFYETYVSKVKGENIKELLISQVEELRSYFEGMTEEQARETYEDGKWSLKEVIGHINDTEKIMLFRALCFARKDDQELPGMDQEDYVKAARFNDVPLANLLEEFELSRYVIRSFMNHLPEEALTYTGTANGYEISVRALLNIIPGHFRHHMQILHERY